MTIQSFTVGFAGARDSYQVPIALAEAGLLARFVTDFYSPDWAASTGIPGLRKLGRRHRSGLSSKLSTNSYKALIAGSRGILSKLAARVTGTHDPQELLSEAALQAAISTGSNLLLYAGYARIAFEHRYSKDARKILFMYHPHIQLSSEILLKDMEDYPEGRSGLARLQKDMEDRRVDGELAMADHVICASAFTARSVRHIGIPEEKITVIPYGVGSRGDSPSIEKEHARCNFLFVGSGMQRKGLHILCRAWTNLHLPKSHLTIVCRSVEPNLLRSIPTSNATYVNGVSSARLRQEYARAHVFVMPSLVEGFGYVFLEALRSGCYCIGTENTGLPDLRCPPSVGDVVPPGGVAELEAALVRAYELYLAGELNGLASRLHAAQYPWSRFGDSVVDLCAMGTPVTDRDFGARQGLQEESIKANGKPFKGPMERMI
jgi:glycosyltransferase involved in cell wall biosynthesis